MYIVDGSMEGMASALAQLARISRDMSRRPALIDEARKAGATWEQIAAATQMSRAGVIKLYGKQKSEQSEAPTS